MARQRRKNELTELKLTPEGWVYLVVLGFITVGSVLRNVNLLIVLAGMMYAPLLLNWRAGIRWLKSFRATRRVPKRIYANELASIQWTCENRLHGMAAWNVVINDRISRMSDANQTIVSFIDDESAQPQSWFVRWFGEIYSRIKRPATHQNRSEIKLGFVRINAAQSEVDSYRVYFSQRGKYLVGPGAVSTTFPFGLIVSRLHFPKTETIFVGPEIGKLHPTWERRVQSVASGSDTVKRERSLEEDEFYALRPWRSGDSKKHIHWRTSAKYGQPIVKQHDQQNNRDFALMLDLFGGPEDESAVARCERALSFSATAILQIRNAVQGQVSIGVAGEESGICQSRTQHGIVVDAMRRLAVAKCSVAPKSAELLIQLSTTVSSGTPIYVVSSRPRPALFDPSNLIIDSEDADADRTAKKRLRRVLPLLRWIEVDSAEFNSMFTMRQNDEHEGRLKHFSERWSEC